jgi:hypothetical protein
LCSLVCVSQAAPFALAADVHEDPQTFLLLHHIYCLKNGRPARSHHLGQGSGQRQRHHQRSGNGKKLKAIGAAP